MQLVPTALVHWSHVKLACCPWAIETLDICKLRAKIDIDDAWCHHAAAADAAAGAAAVACRPGGIRQQFKAAQPLVEQILRAVKQVRIAAVVVEIATAADVVVAVVVSVVNSPGVTQCHQVAPSQATQTTGLPSLPPHLSPMPSFMQVKGLEGPLAPEIWDQGDAVAAWTSPNLACVLFPSGATMDRVSEGQVDAG